jgi:hypothetical protein
MNIYNIRTNIYDKDRELVFSGKFYSLIELGEFLADEDFTVDILDYDNEEIQ